MRSHFAKTCTLLLLLIPSLPASSKQLTEVPSAKETFTKLLTTLTTSEFHLNSKYPQGIREWQEPTKKCDWTSVTGEKEEQKKIRKLCKRLLAYGFASTIRNTPDPSGVVAQEVWFFRLKSSKDADRAICELREIQWGPFGKYPYTLFRHGERDIMAVESRHRFPKYQKELAKKISQLPNVSSPKACPKPPKKKTKSGLGELF